MTDDTTRAIRPPRWQTAIAVALIVAAIVFCIWFIRVALRAFAALEPAIAAAIISAFAAVMVAVLTATIARQFERRAAAERAQQEKRIPVYVEFVTGLFDSMGIGKPQDQRQPLNEEVAIALLAKFTKQLVIWGSDDVLKAWVDYRYTSIGDTGRSQSVLYKLENLFLAFRKDLGLSNKKLDRGDLLRLFINDLHVEDADTASTSRP